LKYNRYLYFRKNFKLYACSNEEHQSHLTRWCTRTRVHTVGPRHHLSSKPPPLTNQHMHKAPYTNHITKPRFECSQQIYILMGFSYHDKSSPTRGGQHIYCSTQCCSKIFAWSEILLWRVALHSKKTEKLKTKW